MKQIDKKSILERAKAKKTDRKAVSFKFDEKAYGPFEAKCKKDGVAVTRVLEELMLEYCK